MTTIADDMHAIDNLNASLPPGPRKLPYLGNLLSLRQDPLGYLQKLQRTYRNMTTIYLGRQPVVLLFRPEYVRSVLVENHRYFSNQGVTLTQADDNTVASEGLLLIDGERHRQQRRALQPAFHKKHVESYATIIEQYTQEMLSTWHVGDTLDMSRSMQQLTLRIICKCLFSIDLDQQVGTLGNAFNGMIGSTTSLAEDMLRIRIDNPLTGYGKRMAATRQIDTLIYTLLSQRRTQLERQAQNADEPVWEDMISMLISAYSGDEAEPKLTTKQIRDHMLTFLAAGHETTANALVWTFYLLAQHPQVSKKLQEELHTVLAGRTPTVEDLARLPYLDWVIKESLRLYPPAWMQARFVAQEFELDGTRLPVGTLVMMSQWIIHRLPELWEDAEVFRPERWDPAKSDRIPAGAYYPFGAGPRICIGMPLAQLEAKIILTTILQQYIPRPVPDYTPGRQALITLRPKNNLRVTLFPTTTQNAAEEEKILRIISPSINQNVERQGCRTLLLGLFGLK